MLKCDCLFPVYFNHYPTDVCKTCGGQIEEKKETPRQILKAKLWEHCKRIIRARDENECQKCGKYISGSNAHTSHVIPKSYSLRMYYDILNLKLLCGNCHLRWWHKNPLDASEWFKEKFPKRWQYLMIRKIEVQSMGGVKLHDLEEWLAEFEGVAE